MNAFKVGIYVEYDMSGEIIIVNEWNETAAYTAMAEFIYTQYV